jgi:hypothetical protein
MHIAMYAYGCFVLGDKQIILLINCYRYLAFISLIVVQCKRGKT